MTEYCEISGSPIKEDTVNIARTALVDLSISLNTLFQENAELKAALEIADKLIEERNRVLKELECDVHGQCVPGAIEKIRELKAALLEVTGNYAIQGKKLELAKDVLTEIAGPNFADKIGVKARECLEKLK